MADCDAIVIGSGAGGLTAALALARAGQRVVVLEQHELPGGWTHSFRLGGFTFSPGVHYLGECAPGDGLHRIYDGLGLELDLLELNRDGYDRIRVGDARVDVPRGRERYAERLKRQFPHESDGIDGWLSLMARIADDLRLAMRIGGVRDALTAPWRLRTLLRYGHVRLGRLLDGFVRDPVLKAMLTIQAGDHGMPPSRAPALIHAGVCAHYFDGAWYPRGGGRALPRAFLRQLRRHGGKIRMRTRAESILIERGRVAGVRLAGGEVLRADVVVSNADPGVTWGRLVDPAHQTRWLRRRLARTRWSVSALSLFLGVDMDARAAGLDSGNIWYSRTPDIEAFYDLARRDDLSGSGPFPGAFLTCTTLKDPSKRTDGLHAMESFVFVSPDAFRRWAHSRSGDRPADYERAKEALADRMLDTLDDLVPGLRERVVFRALGTPLTNEHYVAATGGNLYGTEKRLRNLGPFGFPVRTHLPGLYQCGASTVSHGVSGATTSGLLAAQAVLGCRSRDLLTGAGKIRLMPSEDPDSWPEDVRPVSERVDDLRSRPAGDRELGRAQ